MTSLATYLIAFWLGLLSTLHCLGMCGGISTALTLTLPPQIRSGYPAIFRIVAAWNLGRVLSYTLAGALAGGIGLVLAGSLPVQRGYSILQWSAGLILVALGLHIAGWFPQLRRLEGYGYRVWRLLQPLGGKLFPIDSFVKGCMIGMLWGWLPCGLVYSVLIWSVTSADPLQGATYMLCFGLGTLPGMVSAGVFGGVLQDLLRNRWMKRAAGLLIILFGLGIPLLHLSPGPLQHHTVTPGHSHH